MSKRTRGKKSNATQPRRGRVDRQDRSDRRLAAPPPTEPEILREIADTLDEDGPLPLFMLVSGLLASLDPPRSPFEPEPDVPTRDELVETFVGIDRRETSALLAVIGELVDDDLLRHQVGAELRSRGHPLPRWVTELGRASAAEPVIEAVDVLGDAATIAVGVCVPGADEMSVMVYVDHNLGTVVNDAMVIPEPLTTVRERIRAAADDDVSIRQIDPADARARIEDAIHTGSLMFPPLESDGWPAARPLVEWALRLLPSGGRTYERPEWSDEELAALSARFLASTFGSDYDDPDHRGLLESLVWFGTDYGPGDPMRWSPSAVEILLADWIPRKIVADVPYLAKAPALLRAWIRFCHDERGIRSELTSRTIATVDELEREYQETIRSPRPQGPAALLAAMGLSTGEDEAPIPLDAAETIMLEGLCRAVGGQDALDKLDIEPLPDEPFDRAAIPDDVHARVDETLGLVDRCCDALLDVEYRTAARRLLARAAAGDPEIFRRGGRADTLAGAVCWSVGKANRLFEHGGIAVKDLAAHFGLGSGTISQRSKVVLAAVGVEPSAYQLDLGSPDYLVSDRRRPIVADRDRYRATAAANRGQPSGDRG